MSAERAAVTEAWTIQRVLEWAASDFRARGLPSPRLDAELLLAEALGTDRVRLVMERQRPLETDELSRVRELIKRRRTGEPIAYILGRREFYGLTFRVDRRVLIPRPDTEVLVDVALARTREKYMFGNMLDLCTGSGSVAIAFAKQRPTWRVTAVDASADAIDLAHENSVRLSAVFTTSFYTGDLWAPLEPASRFDLITANPPYIPSQDVNALDVSIRDFEPRLALDGGADGLDLVRRIVSESGSWLAPGGVLAVEVQFDQAERVLELFRNAGFGALETKRDYGGHERVVSGVLG